MDGSRQKKAPIDCAASLAGCLFVFAGGVLPFDLACTPAYTRLLAKTRKPGQTIAMADACIAAIAATHDYAVATRDTSAF